MPHILKVPIAYSLQSVYKVVCIYDKFSKPVALCRGKNAFYKLIKSILE